MIGYWISFALIALLIPIGLASIKIWGEKGLGWLCETSETKIVGLTDVVAYYGTSSYNTSQMAVFVDYVVQEAKQLNIETLTPRELAILKTDWGNYERY